MLATLLRDHHMRLTDDQLLRERVAKIRRLISEGRSTSETQVAQVAALDLAGDLRQLLCDTDRALLVRVKSMRSKANLRFKVAGESGRPPDTAAGLVLWAVADGLDPAWAKPSGTSLSQVKVWNRDLTPAEIKERFEKSSPFGRVATLNLDTFLATPVLAAHGKDYTVLQVIKFLTNVEGGVHRGEPESQEEAELAALSDEIGLLGMPVVHATVFAIGSVTAAAGERLLAFLDK
jgi:hypothetical protein